MADKIAILGIGGSGKSTLGREIAKLAGLPLFHTDHLFWKGNWQEVSEAEYLPEHEKIVAKERWIIEGSIDPAMVSRVKRADLIIYLDYPALLCASRVVQRWLKYRKEGRPEMSKEAVETFNPSFIWRVLTRKERIPLEAALESADSAKIMRLHSPSELKKFLKTWKRS